MLALHPMLLIYLTTLTFLKYGVCEVFTAMADIELLLRSEKDITSMIDGYIEAEMRRLEKLRKVAAEYEEKNQKSIEAGLGHISNPLNSYLLIKRLTTDWSYLESLMKNNMAEVFLQNVTNQRGVNLVRFPDEEDLKGAAVALMRLQDVYKLDARDMAEGKIKGVKTSAELEAHDCFELGRTAYNDGDYYHTLMWMQEALNRLEHEDPPTAMEEDILEYLAYSLYQQGNLKRALALTRRLKKLDPNHPRVDGNIKWYEDMMAKEGMKRADETNFPPVVNPRKDDGGFNERDVYEALCRGEYPLDDQVNHKIAEKSCSYHEISAWLKPEEHPILMRISKRQDDMSDLSMETAEDLQVANYGIGGHYDPHYDISTRGETDPYGENLGNRIATILHYMSTPEEGGATVFPELKVALFPTKYDAVFWHNLLKSGEGDMTTRHAACPVLIGVKWVSNRWLHERGQEFRRPCGLDENEYE